ncbi:divalent metal cation transporter MntH [Bacteroidota bacterium]|nr:divalent metal cation transporter MntH [Bacteroidota bacterium]
MISKNTSTKSLEEVHSSVETKNKNWWRTLFAFLGPAYMVSVGYMDPGNWATDIAAGSAYGYKLIWVLLMSNLIALLLQSHCVRLGIVRGRDLAQASKEMYHSIINIPLYILAEIAIAACDLAEVLGLAIGLNLLFHIPLLGGVTIAVFDCLILLTLMNIGIRKMEVFIIGMVVIMGGSFLVELLMAKPDVGDIAAGFIPSIPYGTALYLTIGIIGATVMPHNLYLHSSLVQTRKIERTVLGMKKAIKFNIFDSAIALNLALFVNAAILILAASVFFTRGMFNIADINDAHKLLEPLLGSSLAPILFAFALIASGQSSTITGTLAGQIIMEGYLNLRITPWLRRLITRMLAVVPAFLVLWFYGEGATGSLLILSQVILSMQLGFAVIPLIHFVSDKKKMGEFAIGFWLKLASWVSAIVIVTLNVKLVSEEIISLMTDYNNAWWIYVFVLPIAAIAGILLLYITFGPFIFRRKEREIKIHDFSLPELQSKEQFKRIAITLDFSKHDSNTISQALSIGGTGAEYHLIHVLESAGALLIGNQISDKEEQEDIEHLIQVTKELIDNGFNSSFELGYGKRSFAIAKSVFEFKADLLVMGTHGHRGLKDIVFGETISRVRHLVKIPVLAVS